MVAKQSTRSTRMKEQKADSSGNKRNKASLAVKDRSAKNTPNKKTIALEIMHLLQKKYPEAACELKYDSPFQLLIATILSAQTTDTSVNSVTGNLFKKYPEAKSLANADLDDIRKIIRATGYFNAKAANIQACAQQLVEQYNGNVPKTQAELITLRGVGRKTANVVLGEAFGVPGWTIDTHVQRLSKRLGFTKESDPLKIEKDLDKLFPNQNWSKLSITLIFHGRRICFARKPACHLCPVDKLCPSAYKIK